MLDSLLSAFPMNFPDLFSPNSVCNSGAGEGAQVDVRPRATSPSFITRIMIKMSRAKWFMFLRRVFRYQNGSGSDCESNLFDSSTWMVLEFVSIITQIVVATFTLAISKLEKPVFPIRMWIVGYDIGYILSLLLLFKRYKQVFANRMDGLSLCDLEQQRSTDDNMRTNLISSSQSGLSQASLDVFFAIWFVMGNVWIFDPRFQSGHQAPKLHALCIALLAWSALCYSIQFMLFLLLCCCVPIMSIIVGYNLNSGLKNRGALQGQDMIEFIAEAEYIRV